MGRKRIIRRERAFDLGRGPGRKTLMKMERVYRTSQCARLLHGSRNTRAYPAIADAILGRGDKKRDVKSLYLAINDADLVREIDRLTFDHGRTEIWGQK